MAKSILLSGRKKKKPARRVSTKLTEPDISKANELNGQQFSRLRDQCYEYYRWEAKSADCKRYVIDYCKSKDEWKDKTKAIQKNPDWRFGSTLGASCRLLSKGFPDTHKAYSEYWESLPGTMGKVKPVSDFVNKQLNELFELGNKVIEEVKEKEKELKKKKIVVGKPTIQERIQAQTFHMRGGLEDWLDGWQSNSKKFDPKGFRISKHLNDMKCTQAHARKMKELYQPEIDEIMEVLNPPTKSQLEKMDEHQRDWAEQLIEGYNLSNKDDIKKYYEALTNIMGALDVIIDTAKANRKPRKRRRDKEKMVSKLKFRVNDEKFQLASINPQEIIGASELWVFNIKTRKLGRYVVKTIDPLLQRREGSGLSVKGTTIQSYNEDESIQKTLRKPEEKLKEFKEAGKIKVKKFLDEINAVDIKLNGRINPETILLKTVD